MNDRFSSQNALNAVVSPLNVGLIIELTELVLDHYKYTADSRSNVLK